MGAGAGREGKERVKGRVRRRMDAEGTRVAAPRVSGAGRERWEAGRGRLPSPPLTPSRTPPHHRPDPPASQNTPPQPRRSAARPLPLSKAAPPLVRVQGGSLARHDARLQELLLGQEVSVPRGLWGEGRGRGPALYSASQSIRVSFYAFRASFPLCSALQYASPEGPEEGTGRIAGTWVTP